MSLGTSIKAPEAALYIIQSGSDGDDTSRHHFFLSLQFCRLNFPQESLVGSGESRSELLSRREALVPKKTLISGFLTLSIAHPKVYYDR